MNHGPHGIHGRKRAWIASILFAAIGIAWWASEYHPVSTVFVRGTQRLELGHRHGGWAYLAVTKRSKLRDLGLNALPSGTFHLGSSRIEDWDALLDSFPYPRSITMAASNGSPSVVEQEMADARWLPKTSFQSSDGWTFVFIPYWMIAGAFVLIGITYGKWRRRGMEEVQE
ncbi:hypothetical protein [Haloferula sp.]|uniref:hypothetical protein n=1 Tax=Haloferula sp. TaxID=2497595 RepID=UPI003C75A0EC